MDAQREEEEVLFPQPTASDHPLIRQYEKGGAPSFSSDGLARLTYQMVIVRLKRVSCLENNPVLKCYSFSIVCVWYCIMTAIYARLYAVSENTLSSCCTVEAV